MKASRVAAVGLLFADQALALLDQALALVDRAAGLNHEHDAARALEQAGKLLNGVRPDNLCAFGFVGHEIVDFRNSAIEYRNLKAVVVHVEDEVLAHDGQANEGDVCVLGHDVRSR